VGIVICVMFSACFSGTETALTALSERTTRQLIERRTWGSRFLQAWLDRPNRILATLLVGNTLVNIAASVLSVRVAFWFFGRVPNGQAIADAAAVLGATLVLLIFGEVSPKIFAKHNAQRVAVPAMMFVRLIEVPLFPVAWSLSKLARVVVRAFGGDPSHSQPVVTEEEIEYMIELGAREKVFEETERGQLLEAALEFGDTIAKEVMIPRTESFAIDAATSIKDAVNDVIMKGHSRVPVYDESIDEVVGVLYAKDLLKAAASTCDLEAPVKPLVRSTVFFVPETQKIADTLKEMQRLRIHLGVVVDEFGGFSGIITLEDILEELVGEIHDEYDEAEELVHELDDGTFIVNAKISIFDLGDLLNVELPDDGDYQTLGGFVVSLAGRVPEVGSRVEWNGLDLEVVEADERRVEKVRITRQPAPTPEGRESPEEPAGGTPA
jgi:CBS domain containing-hemolysin-like protein